jgi:hypothetical protein
MKLLAVYPDKMRDGAVVRALGFRREQAAGQFAVLFVVGDALAAYSAPLAGRVSTRAFRLVILYSTFSIHFQPLRNYSPERQIVYILRGHKEFTSIYAM